MCTFVDVYIVAQVTAALFRCQKSENSRHVASQQGRVQFHAGFWQMPAGCAPCSFVLWHVTKGSTGRCLQLFIAIGVHGIIDMLCGVRALCTCTHPVGVAGPGARMPPPTAPPPPSPPWILIDSAPKSVGANGARGIFPPPVEGVFWGGCTLLGS